MEGMADPPTLDCYTRRLQFVGRGSLSRIKWQLLRDKGVTVNYT